MEVELHVDAAGRVSIIRDGQEPVRLRSEHVAIDWLNARGIQRNRIVIVDVNGARYRYDKHRQRWYAANTQAQVDEYNRAQIESMFRAMERWLRRLTQ